MELKGSDFHLSPLPLAQAPPWTFVNASTTFLQACNHNGFVASGGVRYEDRPREPIVAADGPTCARVNLPG